MFLYFFLSCCVFVFSFLCFMSSNFFVWWSVFLMMTVFFVMINKSSSSFSSVFNYFIIQESLGLFFLIFCLGGIQAFIIMMKIGVAPLHFWVFSVSNNIFGFGLVWFLTFQKLPFLFVFLQFIFKSLVWLLVLGLVFCYFQIFSIKNYKSVLVISSTESFNWIVLGAFFSLLNSFTVFIYYFFLMLFLIGKFGKFDFSFVGWETVLVFLNIPFSVSFFVKIFSLSEILKFESLWTLLVLFFMFLSSLSLSFWLINISMKSLISISPNSKTLFFLVYPAMLLLVV